MRLFTILTCLFLLACSTRQGTAHQQIDSVITVTIDTTISEEEPDFRQEFITLYGQKVQLDTAYMQNGSPYRVILTHYCTMDSALAVPAKYNWDTAEDFVTHNFQSDISLSTDSGVLFRK